MKKFLVFVLVFALSITLLSACKKKNAGATNNTTTTTDPTEVTEPFDITATGNYYQDLSEPEFVKDALTYKLYQAWWEEDALMMEIYFINGHDAPVTDLFIENFEVYNDTIVVDGEEVEGGLIASAQIGPLESDGEPIAPNTYKLITLCLTNSTVELPNADLSTMSIVFTPDYIW